MILGESHGIGVFKKVIKVFTFLGLLTNISIIFFTDTRLIDLDYATKVFTILFVENFVLIFLLFVGFKSLPVWFKYREKLEISYLTKYGYMIHVKDQQNFKS